MAMYSIRDLAGHVGEEVDVRGWMTHFRSSGKIHFMILRDGTGSVQAVIKPANLASQPVGFDTFEQLEQESAMAIRGLVRADQRAPSGVELDVTGMERLSPAPGYPIQPKEHGVDL